MEQRYYFIVNPAAGKGRHLRYIQDIEEFFRKKKIGYDIVLTKGRLHATELVQVASDSYSHVVAVGGDGTVNEVVNGLMATSKKPLLGVLPMGSGNDFAHQLGFGHSIQKNLDYLISGEPQAVDVGQLNNTRYFVNGYSLGFDSEVAMHFREYTKFVSGFPAYLLSVFRTLPSYRCKNAQIILDDSHTIIAKTFLIAVCNGTTYGGGFKVAPSAKMNDGVLTICLVKKIGKLYALRKLPLFMRGAHTHLPEVETYTAKKIDISVDPETHGQIDGEVEPSARSYSIRLLPKSLFVVMPRKNA